MKQTNKNRPKKISINEDAFKAVNEFKSSPSNLEVEIDIDAEDCIQILNMVIDFFEELDERVKLARLMKLCHTPSYRYVA